MNMKFFYKFGTIYREWLIKFDINVCETLSGRPVINPLAQLIKSFWVDYVGKDRKCPFTNEFILALNANNSSSSVMFKEIPRLPQGDFKITNRFYTTKNETIFCFEVKMTIKSKSGVGRVSMLDMG